MAAEQDAEGGGPKERPGARREAPGESPKPGPYLKLGPKLWPWNAKCICTARFDVVLKANTKLHKHKTLQNM